MKLWRDYGKVGGISKANFKQYYKGSTNAFALTIDDRRRFDRPIALQALTPAPAIPQSFSYVGDDVLRQVLELQDLATLN